VIQSKMGKPITLPRVDGGRVDAVQLYLELEYELARLRAGTNLECQNTCQNTSALRRAGSSKS